MTQASERRLYRSRSDKVLGGVLGGFAHYMGWDPAVVRILFALLVLVTGFFPGVVLYLVALVVVPEEPWPTYPPPVPSAHPPPQ